MSKNPVVNYVLSSIEELRKVTWPTRNQAIKLTIIVLGFSLFMAFAIAVVDGLFNAGYKLLLTLT